LLITFELLKLSNNKIINKFSYNNTPSNLFNIIPYINKTQLINEDFLIENEDMESPAFSEETILKLLHTILKLLLSSQHFEDCIEILKILIYYYEKSFNYKKTNLYYLQIHELNDKIDNSIVFKNRILSLYYRVRFYGVNIGDLNGKNFVYRMDKYCKLQKAISIFKNYISSYGNVINIISHSGSYFIIYR
jgi:hypothetical protein